MQWLPPTYRIIYSKELNFNKEQFQYIESKLNAFIDESCLFCLLDDSSFKPIARVVNVERKANKLCFWLDEIKPNIFKKLNIHLESYYIELNMDFTFKDSDPTISNLLKMKEIEDVRE